MNAFHEKPFAADWEKILVGILCFYAVFSLSAMAGMNLAFLLVVFGFTGVMFFNSGPVPAKLIHNPEFKRYLQFGGLLFFACLLSLIVAKIFPVRYADHAPEITVHGFLKIWYLFCPFVLATLFVSLPSPQQALFKVRNAWWIATLFLSALAVVQFFTGWPFPQAIPDYPNHFHAVLFFGHHLSTASIIIFPTFVALAQLIGLYQRENEIDRFAFITSIAGVLILFLSYARTAWLSVPIGIAILLFRYLKPRNRWFSLGGMGLVLLIASQFVMIQDRISKAYGINERFELWKANIDFFQHNPLTGIGWLKTAEMSEFYFKQIDPIHYKNHFWGHAHSNFFEMLGGTGLIGLIAFLAWSIYTLKLAYRASEVHAGILASREEGELSDFAYGLGVALVVLHINGLTNVTFWEGKVMHQQMFAVAMLIVIQVIQANPTSQKKQIFH